MKTGQVKGVNNRRDQQILEKTQMIFIMATLINTALLIVSLLGVDKSGMWLQLITCVIGYIALAVIYVKQRGTFWGMYNCLYVLLFIYILGFWTTNNTYVYALMYPIAMTVIFIMDSTLGMRGIVAAITVNIIYVVIHFIRCGLGDWQQTISQLILAIVACVISGITIMTLDKHNRENIDDLQDTAAANLETSNKVVGASNNISTQLDDAQDLISSLTSSIDLNNDSMSEIADSMRQTAEAIEHQTAMTSEIQDNLQNAENLANHMQESSTHTMEVVGEGTALLNELKVQSQKTGEINETTRQTTNELNERIKEVANIITTITNISDDTTLLSLNASIEAARAGEAGKGFAVVADEIRKLSEETRNSAAQIADIINKLVEDVENASKNMELSAKSAEQQSEMIETTSEKFDVVYAEVKSLANDVDGITAEVNGIVKANTMIMDSITNLSATSEEISSVSDSSLEIANSSKAYMEQMNAVLNDIHNVSNDMKILASPRVEE
ncbi:MAG: methyl-accepting chemotaxis protein [Lachnospiraceae bacterium]|nr:methyl-accepting chemotaxis protein [Lachnospiraceae bacterium]